MGYALFTARKLSVTTRLNMCNANLACNTEKTYSLSNSIFVQQSKRDLELNLGINAVKKAIEINKSEEEYCLLLISFYKLKKDTVNLNKAVENCNKTMKMNTDSN